MGKGEISSRVRIPTCPPERVLTVFRQILIAGCAALTIGASAQSLQDYAKLRKSHGVTRAVDAATLETFIGKRVFEIQGKVMGIVGTADGKLLLIETSAGVQHYVQAKESPEWMNHGQVQARLLVECERRAESTALKANLIAAATDSDVVAIESRNPAVAKAAPTKQMSGPITSRRGGRPASMPGSVPTYVATPRADSPALSESLQKILPSYISFVQGWNKKLTDDEASRIATSILGYSAKFGVDPRLIVAVIITESDFNPKTRSRAGAMGLGQLMPVNVRELGLSDGYDIEQNLYGTVRLVRGHIDKYSKKTDDQFEALVLALAGYNAGDGAVKKHGGVPPYRETQNYVKKVIARYKQLCGQ